MDAKPKETEGGGGICFVCLRGFLGSDGGESFLDQEASISILVLTPKTARKGPRAAPLQDFLSFETRAWIYLKDIPNRWDTQRDSAQHLERRFSSLSPFTRVLAILGLPPIFSTTSHLFVWTSPPFGAPPATGKLRLSGGQRPARSGTLVLVQHGLALRLQQGDHGGGSLRAGAMSA